MKTKRNLFALFALLMLVLSACTPMVVPVSAASPGGMPGEAEMLEFDISEDMTRFIFDKDVVYEDGLPADGSSFITRGYIYEAGTLEESNGVNADGSPEYPEKLVGEWICQGYMINDAGHAKGGVWVFSTQFFQFGTEPGAQTLVTTGYELADVGVAIARAITGGSGEYSTARGEASQTMLGLNATEGVNLRVQIKVQK